MSNLPPINQDIPIMTINTDFQEHSWVQHGRDISCGGHCSMNVNSNSSSHGTRLPAGVHITGERGNWKIEMQRGNVIDPAGRAFAQRLERQLMEESR